MKHPEVDLSYFRQAIDELINKVSQSQGQALRIEQPMQHAPDVACIDWLEAQPHFPKFYWQSRDTREEVVALGQVHTFSEPAPAYIILGENQRVWGGKAFDSASAYFFLPQIELVRFDSTWSICVNLADDKESIISALKSLVIDYAVLMPISTHICSIEHAPSQRQWQSQITDVLTKIDQAQFKKVVLARKSQVKLDSVVSGAQLLKASRQKNKHSFHFLFALDNEQAFIGSTPERLYSRVGQELETEALAGTIGRGENAQKDLELANWLAQDTKNLTENQYVVDDIVERLTPHANRIHAQVDARLIRLRKVQHLKREIQATLKTDVNGVQLLSALQPTAAVAGLPRESAIKYIHENEPFARGWYSGSMGYISHQKAEFCVAIRSALVCHDEVHLFAGAGIVKGSQADTEWLELDRKMATLLCLLQENWPLEVAL